MRSALAKRRPLCAHQSDAAGDPTRAYTVPALPDSTQCVRTVAHSEPADGTVECAEDRGPDESGRDDAIEESIGDVPPISQREAIAIVESMEEVPEKTRPQSIHEDLIGVVVRSDSRKVVQPAKVGYRSV